MKTVASPVCVLARTDSELSSLFHSFYLLKYNSGTKATDVTWRVPERRARIEDIESGLAIFVNNIFELELAAQDVMGSFVITTSDGSRFFAYWRGNENLMFVGVSKFPLSSFARQVFALMQLEAASSIPQILLNLCETPVLPAANTQYEFKLPSGSATLNFSSIEQVDDLDVNMIATTLLSPSMIVAAWEAILMERKLLVTSVNSGVIPACCEFLRRAVAPFSIINTYVPLLPEQLLGTIEAPFPYLLGANSVQVKNAFIDTSEVLILDIDNRCIVEPQIKETLVRAPADLRERLVAELNAILMGPMAKYCERTAPSDDPTAMMSAKYPFSEQSINARATAMLSVLIRTSISLLTARCCRIRGFFYHQPTFEKSGKSLSTGFNKSNDVAFGCLQLLLVRSTGVTRIPCWFEMDSQALLVYRYADEMPLLTVFNRNIVSIFPSLLDPVDQVFDLNVKPNKQYVFEALDSESRSRWIEEVENAIVSFRTGSSGAAASSTAVESPRAGDSIVSKKSFSRDDGKPSAVVSSAEHELTLFRSALLETQMASYLKPKLEFDDYETILNELQLDCVSLTEPSPGPSPQLDMDSDDRATLNRDDITMKNLVSLWNEHVCTPLDEDSESTARMTFIMGADGTVETDIEMLKDDDDDEIPDRSPSLAVASATSPNKTESQPQEKSGFGSSLKNFFRRSSTDDKPSASVDKLSKSVSQLQKSAADAGEEPGANLLVKLKEKEELDKIDLCCEMITDLHRTNDHELKKTIIEERTWRIRLLLGDEDALKNRNAVLVPMSSAPATSSSGQKQLFPSSLGARPRTKSVSKIAQQQYLVRISVYTSDPDQSDMRASGSDAMPSRGGSEAAKWLEGIINDTVLDDEDVYVCQCSGNCNSGASLDVSKCGKCGVNHVQYKWGKVLKQWSLLGFVDAPTSPVMRESDDVATPDGFTSSESSAVSPLVSPQKDLASLFQQQPASTAPQRRKLNSSNSLENYRSRLIRELMDQVASSRNDESLHALFSVLRTLMGYVYERSNEVDEAIYAYAEGCLMGQNRLMRCIVQKFVRIGTHSNGFEDVINNEPRACNSNELETFLVWATGCGEIVKFQVFQFILELLFRTLSRRRMFVSAEEMNVRGTMSLPRARITQISLGENGFASRASVKTSNNGSASNVGQLSNAPRSILNETVMCSKSTHEPCDLSVMLLQRVRDVVRGSCLQEFTKGDVASFSGQNSELIGDKRFGLLQLKYRDSIRDSILQSAGYRSFEMSICELQKVDVSSYSDDEKTLFFVNIHNTLTVHSLIANGPPGPSLFEHFMFMRNAKYNIGGIILNLMDIEHSILRGSSTNALPAVFKRNLFSDRDVRSKLQIMRTKPQLSYVLFTATMSSPPLTVLYDVATLETDISFCTVRYLCNVVRVDLNTKTLFLPELVQYYWKDFNAQTLNVCKLIMGEGTAALQADVAKLIELTQNPKIVYVPYDWSPAFVLPT